MNASARSRPSPREELATLTRTRIMEGLATLLRSGESDVTFDLVARESGVPVRTVYRYFESKEVLFDSFWRWLNEFIEMPPLPATPDEVISHIPDLFAAFDRDEPLVRAVLHNPYGRAVRIGHAEARRNKFATALRPLLEGMPRGAGRHLLASVTALCSASGWESMKDNWNLNGAEAAAAAQWAVRALILEADRTAREQVPARLEGEYSA